MGRSTRVAFLAAGAALLIALALRIDWVSVGRVIAAARPSFLLAGVALGAANVAVKGVRWQAMVRRLTGRPLSFGRAVLAVLAGVAAASLSPARSIDLAKPLLLRRSHGTSLATGTGAVLVERLFDGIALVVLFGIALLALPLARGARLQPVVAAAGVLLAVGALTLLAPRALHAVLGVALRLLASMPRAQSLLRRAGDAFIAGVATWRTTRTLGVLAALSIAAAILEAGRLAAVASAVGASMSLGGAMLVFSAANLVAIAALIPGGIGVTELTMGGAAALVTGLRAAAPAVAAIVLLDRLLSYYLVVALGAVVIVTSGRVEEVLPTE